MTTHKYITSALDLLVSTNRTNHNSFNDMHNRLNLLVQSLTNMSGNELNPNTKYHLEQAEKYLATNPKGNNGEINLENVIE